MRTSLTGTLALAALLVVPTGVVAEDDDAVAIFAGGCFWCMEEVYDAVDGVTSTTSGFIGGHVAEPSYRQVVSGGTGHAEAVEVRYDPSAVSYEELVEVFWRNVDPLDGGGQFCDRGDVYRSGIFFGDEAERHHAEETKTEVAARFGEEVATEVTEATEFYEAEEYHQGYYLKNPLQYGFYKRACGREARLEELWGEPGS